jgi:two-component system cell cycle response regulator
LHGLYHQAHQHQGLDRHPEKNITGITLVETLKGISMMKSKILVADDDALNVKLMAAMLPADTYDKILAYSGLETLEKVEENMPDLILLDVMMPDLDGFEVTETLKNNDRFQDIPIILITALDGLENKIKAIECGADEFINKPVLSRELMARVESLLKLRSYQNQLKFSGPANPEGLVSRDFEGSGILSLNLPSILLVEDDEKDAKLIHSMLGGEPYQLKWVKTGEQAIEAVRAERIDVLLLDILLPGLDGFQVCRLLKEKDATKNIQVVAITNLMDLESKIKGINQGVDEYLVKPINRYELKIRIKAMVKKKAYLDSLRVGAIQRMTNALEDPLTGLYVHGYFQHLFELEIRRCKRQETSMCLLVLEILFEPQETPPGVGLIRNIAETIKNNIRDVDCAARLPSGRFAVLLIHTDREGGKKAGERIQRGIEALDSSLEKNGVSMKAVFNLEQYPHQTGETTLILDRLFVENHPPNPEAFYTALPGGAKYKSEVEKS